MIKRFSIEVTPSFSNFLPKMEPIHRRLVSGAFKFTIRAIILKSEIKGSMEPKISASEAIIITIVNIFPSFDIIYFAYETLVR